MEVYFIRHGKTEWNNRGVFQGRTDVPLSDVGLEQAEEAGRTIRSRGITFDRVICSPLKRARQTAVIAAGIPEESLVIDDRIIEMSFGVMEGTDFYHPDYPGCETAKKPFGGLFEDPEHFEAPEGCETFDEIEARISSFLEDLKKLSKEPDGPEGVMVASHGTAIRAMILLLTNKPVSALWSIKIPNCRLFHFTFSGDDITEHPDPDGEPDAWT